ncbi:hypothetical protein [Paenibacillus cremeus]|nr:hypothetical protein [Paenibacillus cremeus]
MRSHPEDGKNYTAVRYELMERFGNDRERYVSRWSQERWRPSESDV